MNIRSIRNYFRARAPREPASLGHRARATILIPLQRQREEWLSQCVNSALQQTAPCEVIVIVSPQTPPSNLAVLLQHNPTLRIIEQQRPGFAAALNDGFAASTTNRVGFLLSDDWLEPTAVEHCLRKSADLVCTGLRCYAADGRTELPTLNKRLSLAGFRRQPTLRDKAKYLQHFFLFRKHMVLEAGGADEHLGDWPGVDDFDLVWTLLENGASVRIVPKLLYNYRDHDDERLTLRRKEQGLATIARILAKHGTPLEKRHALLREYGVWLGRPMYAANYTPKQIASGPLPFKRAPALGEFLKAGFRDEEYFPHTVHHEEQPDPDSRQDLCHYLRDDGLKNGRTCGVSLRSEHQRASAALDITEDCGFLRNMTTVQFDGASASGAIPQLQHWRKMLFNAVLDFALDYGVLSVCCPADHEISNDRFRSDRDSGNGFYEWMTDKYMMSYVTKDGAGYWELAIHSNADRVVGLENVTDPPMRILITTPSFPPIRGGAESALETLAEHFVQDGSRVVVFTRATAVAANRIETCNGVEIRRMPYPPQKLTPLRLPLVLIRSIALLRGLGKVLRRERIEIVCLGLAGIECLYALVLGIFCCFRLVIYIRGGELRLYAKVSHIFRWALTRCLRRSDVVIAVSQQLREEALLFEPSCRTKIAVLPDAIDPGTVRSQPAHFHRRPYALFAGRLHPVKGLDLLLKAFCRVADTAADLDLLIAGTGPLEQHLKRMVCESGKQARIVFRGPQERTAVYSLLKGCEFLLLPSRAEGCPVIVLEAWAAGKMIIASRVKGVNELIHDDQNGVLFEAEDENELIRLILYYHDRPAARMRIEANIQRAGVGDFDVRRLYKTHLDLYRAGVSWQHSTNNLTGKAGTHRN